MESGLVETAPGVFYASTPLRILSDSGIAWLKEQALRIPARRSRICLHQGPEDIVQEMVIAIHQSSYIAPHYHSWKEESFHVIEGQARAVFFTSEGMVENVLELAPAGVGAAAYCYRVPKGVIHGLRIDTEWLVVHEVAMGPFVQGSNATPKWALQAQTDAHGLAWLDEAIMKGSAI